MRRLTPHFDDRVLVGLDSPDDAAVWRREDGRALVATVDYITPVVDDARTWGRVAAVNAVSDVYAMGGRPLFGLNIVSWNTDELGTDLLVEVLEGGAEAAADGGWVVVGGHTIEDPHPLYGQVVIGEADPDRLITTAGLRAGQTLVLTKSLGVGVITTALKQGRADEAWVDAAIASMVTSNRRASEVALAAGATGGTDVTGFGLLGHLRRMLDQAGLGATVDSTSVPTLPGARELAAAGLVPGGSRRNLEWAAEVFTAADVDPDLLLLLADAQTSGGLLFGVDADAATDVVGELLRYGLTAAAVGVVEVGPGIAVR